MVWLLGVGTLLRNEEISLWWLVVELQNLCVSHLAFLGPIHPSCNLGIVVIPHKEEVSVDRF